MEQWGGLEDASLILDGRGLLGALLASWGFMQPDTRDSHLPESALGQACLLGAGSLELSRPQK